MKKILLTFGFLLCVFSFTQAQGLKFGVFVDPQMAWLSPQAREVKSAGTTFGFSGGLIVNNYFMENYAFHTGLGIGWQGGELTYDEDYIINVYDEQDTISGGSTLKFRLNYITVPFGLKLKTNQIGYFSYFARIGLTNQFRIKSTATSSDGVLNNDAIEKEISLYNLAYHFGGGVEYAISEDTALLFGVTYHNGFLDVTDSGNAKVNSRVLAFRVGVMF